MVKENMIQNMRILHFEKIVPLKLEEYEKSLHVEKENSRKEIIFYTLGYYDRMTYVRAESQTSIFDNKHSFLIKYPYRKKSQQIIADQMFSVFSKTDESVDMGAEDPFEYNQKDKKPFLGIILVTVYEEFEGQKNEIYKYEDLIKKCQESIIELVDNGDFKDDCCKIFYTPNCADLCIVIRTDSLKNIYELKYQISHLQYEENDKAGRCHTMTYTLLQHPQEMMQIIKDDNFLKKMKKLNLS